jgi:hypothetical protein
LSLADKPRFELDAKEVERRVRQGTMRGLAELVELYQPSLKETAGQMESLKRLVARESRE